MPILPTDTHFEQAKADGLLEVTALVSGDITRRNRPGHAFRRTMARAMKLRQNERVSPTDEGAKGEGGGEYKHHESTEEKSAEEDFLRHLPRHNIQLRGNLSPVSEADSMSKASSSAYTRSDLGGRDWDPEAGGSGDKHGSDVSRESYKAPVHRFLPRWVDRIGRTGRVEGGGGSRRSIANDGSEYVNSNSIAHDRCHVSDVTHSDHLDDVDAPSSREQTNSTVTHGSRRRDTGVKHLSKLKTATASTELLREKISRDANFGDDVATSCSSSGLVGSATKGRSGLSDIRVPSCAPQHGQSADGESMRSTIRLRDALRQAGVDDRHMFAHPNSVKAGSTPISPRTRDRGRFPGGSSFTKDPEIGSMDHTSGLYTVQSAAAQPVWRQGSTSSFASLIPRTIPQHHLRRSQSSRRSKKGRFAQKKADVARGALTRNTQVMSTLHDVCTSFHSTLENRARPWERLPARWSLLVFSSYSV